MTHTDIEERIKEFKEFYGDYLDEYICCSGHDCNCGGKEALPDAIKWLRQALTEMKEAGAREERQFILNVLDGIDIADEQMGNKGGGTLAIRHALKLRFIGNNDTPQA